MYELIKRSFTKICTWSCMSVLTSCWESLWRNWILKGLLLTQGNSANKCHHSSNTHSCDSNSWNFPSFHTKQNFLKIRFWIWHAQNLIYLSNTSNLSREGILCFEKFGHIYLCLDLGNTSGKYKTWDKIVSLLVYEVSQRNNVRDQVKWVRTCVCVYFVLWKNSWLH